MDSTRECSIEECTKPASQRRRLCSMHYYRLRHWGTTESKSDGERFEEKISRTEECWNWAATQNGRGYGFFSINGRYVQAHRYAYELYVGPIPDGLTIDHLCRNTICVNPSHLEPVTQGENTRRGMIATGRGIAVTACPQGHQYTPENTYIEPKGSRSCRECRRERTREWRRKHRYLTT